MTAAQAHNAPPSPPTVPAPKSPECQGETWRRIAEFAKSKRRLPYSTLHPWPRESCIASSSALAEGLVALQKAGEGRSTVAAGRVGARAWRFTDALEK